MFAPQAAAKMTLEQQSALKLRYARLLLQLFHTDTKQKTITIDQFIADYSQGLQVPIKCRSKLDEQLLIGEYNHLKESINLLTQDYSRNLRKLQQLNTTRYKPIKEIIAQKQKACLQNLQIRLSSIKRVGDNDSEELDRVKKLMENGLWGCLTRLNQRITKLTNLQHDIQ